MPVATLLVPLRRVARHAGPHVLEATLGPTACFLTGRALWGVNGAVALALLWTAGCLGRRRLRGGDAGGLLLIGLTTLVLRAGVSLALHSERAYLVAPAVVTAVTGVVYLVSARRPKPLLARVVGDLLPPAWVRPDDPRVTRLCRIGSAVWGGEQILTAAVSLVMLHRLSTTTYVVVHQLVSWLVMAAVLAVVLPFVWGDVRALWSAGPVSTSSA